MKARTFIAAMLLVVAGVQSALAQRVVVHLSDKRIVKYSVAKVDSISFEEAGAVSFDYVDLGLPSGTLWAECNVGAETPEGFGTYFAWGEVEPKEDYWWTTYKYCNGTEDVMLKYFTSKDGTGLETLLPEDDAATFNWGEEWQTPSEAQLAELLDENYTLAEWTTQNGVAGLKITSKINGNSIFFPAAGGYSPYALEGQEQPVGVGKFAGYWSRTLGTNTEAVYLSFGDPDMTNVDVEPYEVVSLGILRCSGMSVRPVATQETPYRFPIKSIDLNETSIVMFAGFTVSLEATTNPWYADYQELVWESDDETVATVSEYGDVTAVSGGTCTITCRGAVDGDVFAECEVEVIEHKYVDMGLPSGTLWAECNIGALNPSEYGDYFAWGETEPKAEYTWATYKYCNGTSEVMTKYCLRSDNGVVDGRAVLEAEDDAATVLWGSDWQMPIEGQLGELLDGTYTLIESTTQNGISGLKVTSKTNGNTLFFPAGGDYYCSAEPEQVGVCGNYWSRTLFTSSSAIALNRFFPPASTGAFCTYQNRCNGLSIRPVRFQKDPNYDWKVTSIRVRKDGYGATEATLNIDETLQLMTYVDPNYAANKAVTWESDDETVATVTSGGLVTAVGPGTCSIIVRATDGSGVTGEFTITVIDPHPYVDLGLPSGTLWATTNVGAETPEQYGPYFAWGETSQKTNYSYGTYTALDVTELPANKDAATVNWGELWQMPCREQIQELVDEEGLYVTKLWTTQNGVNGWKITSKSNGNSIFLPAAGLFRDEAITGKGERGGYWGRTLDMDGHAWCIYFNTGYCGYNSMSGATGMTVRPVRVQEEPYTWPVLRLELPATLEINEGESAYLSPMIIPNYAHYDDIVLESSDESVATVSGYEVTAVAAGTCTITCRLTNDSSIYAECQVTVQP